MNRGGVGAVSIMLVFVVLCLVIFSVISLAPALAERDLVQAELQSVQDFYAADKLAEQVLAELLQTVYTPESIHGIEITSGFDFIELAYIAQFVVPVGDERVLYVSVELGFGDYRILAWQMHTLSEWEAYNPLNLWDGTDNMFQGW